MKYAALAPLCAIFFLTACRPSPEKLMATANKYHENKKYKEASILYQKVLAKDKKNAEAYYRAGLNAIDEGNPAEAVQYLRRAVDLKPGNIDAEVKLTDIYLQAYLSNPVRAKALLPQIEDLKNKIVQKDPNSFDGLRLDAILNEINKNTDKALDSFARANKTRPYSRDLVSWYAQALYSAQRSDEAESLVRGMLAHDKAWAPGYDFLFLLYRKDNQVAKAEAVLRERVQNDPKSAVAIINLCNYLESSNRFDEGEGIMKRVLDDKTAFPLGHQMLGDYYGRARKFDQALQQFQAGAAEDPKQALSYNERVIAVDSAMGKRDDAVKLAQNLVAKNPNDVTSSEMYAALLLEAGAQSDVKKAVPELTKLVKNNPGSAVLHLDLARAYFATNDQKALGEATDALQQEAKSRNPRSQVILPGRILQARIYQSRGQYAKALEQGDQALKIQDGNPEARLVRDQALIGLNENDQAQPDLVKLLQQYPKLNDASLALASSYEMQKDYAKAAEQFERIWTATPPDVRGYLGLQQIKLAVGKADEAVQGMQSLVDKNPKVILFRYQLASTEAAAAQVTAQTNPSGAKALLEKAADNYKQVLQVEGHSPDPWIRLGSIQRALGQNEPALASFEQASTADPQSVSALMSRAMLLEELGRKKEAGDVYNKALGLDPNNALALNNIAFLNADSGTNLDQAMTFAERAKKQAPKSSDIADTLGYVYFRKNLNSAALDIFRQNVEEQPQNPTFRLHLAMALLKQGDKQGARDEAAKALKAAPASQKQQIESFVNQIG